MGEIVLSIWFLLWFVLAAIILGASGWSTVILFRQKKAWEGFANKNKMAYIKGRVMAPPAVEGYIDRYKISLFTAQRQMPDARSHRYLSVVEITLPDPLIDGGAAGTPEMFAFIESLGTLRPIEIASDKWNKEDRFFVRHKAAVENYLTPERIETVARILKTKNADVLFIFDGQTAVIRLETSDPILDENKMDKIIRRLIADAEKLKIGEEERAALLKKSEDVPDEEVPAANVPAQEQDEGETEEAAEEKPSS